MSIKISKFKGLAQNAVYEELSSEFCHTLQNLDVDDPVGRLTLRDGYTKKYSDVFTDLISAYEYEIPATGDTILLFNDNGTLKYYTNGAGLLSLTLPSGSALESGFKNQFFGYQDHIIVTTGNGATNHVLGFYYLNRENDDNTGLFGNAEEFTGYKLLKSQLVPTQGVVTRTIKKIITVGSYYYVLFEDSLYIEKRDSNFLLLEQILIHEDATGGDSLAMATDGTDIFLGVDDTIYRINPTGWAEEESATVVAGITGLAVDDTNLYIAGGAALHVYLKGNFGAGSQDSDATAFSGVDVACDVTGTLTHIYVLNGASSLERRDKTAVSTVSHTKAVTAGEFIHYNDTTGELFVDSAGDILELNPATLATDTTYSDPQAAGTMFDVSGVTYFVEGNNGTLVKITDSAILLPNFFSIGSVGTPGVTPGLDTGTYFYKASIADTDGIEYTLTDPVVEIITVANRGVSLFLTMLDPSNLDIVYRVASINIYRAYNSDQYAKSPSTDYKFLVNVDINDAGWTLDGTYNIYEYNHVDGVTEANISSVTYQENSGIPDSTKPRYVNYKVMEWVINQLHVANFYADGQTYKSTVIKSQVNGPDAVPFASNNTYEFSPYDGDEILGISSAYSRSYVHKNRKTGIFFQDSLERILNIGIAVVGAVYREGDDIFLISNKGLYRINGPNVEDLTPPFQTDFDAISSFADANVFYRDDKRRVFFSFPTSQVFVHNTLYKTNVKYSAAMGFQGFFKSLENEYIGYGKDAGSSSHYFFEIDGATTDNGTSITIQFETALLKFANMDGQDAELTKINYRIANTGTLTMTLYDYAEGSKRTIETITVEDPASSDLAVKTKFLSDAWGEAFSILFSGTATDFKLASLSIVAVNAGETANV